MDYTMKTRNIIIIMAFLAAGFCACTDESEELLPMPSQSCAASGLPTLMPNAPSLPIQDRKDVTIEMVPTIMVFSV